MNAIRKPLAFEPATLSSKEIRELVINSRSSCSLWELDEKHYALLDAGKPNDLRSIIAELSGSSDQRSADWQNVFDAIDDEEHARAVRNRSRAAQRNTVGERAPAIAN